MASDFRKFIGYSVDEIEEIWPDYLEDERFAPISFRPDDIESVYMAKDPKCQKYVAIQYDDGQILLSDGSKIEDVDFASLYNYFSQPFFNVRKNKLSRRYRNEENFYL